MKTAWVAGLAVAALLGVGVVAASTVMAPGGMGTSAGGGMMGGDTGGMNGDMMGGGMGGMMGGNMQGMHEQMHDQCPCCQGDDPNT